MKWLDQKWFGGFKIECEECKHYAVGKSLKEARNRMRARLIDYWCPYCITCSLESKPRPNVKDDKEDLSLTTRLRNAEAEIKRLKQSVLDWRDAWYHQREIIGELWFHHPSIDSDDKRVWYQNYQKIANELKIISKENK